MIYVIISIYFPQASIDGMAHGFLRPCTPGNRRKKTMGLQRRAAPALVKINLYSLYIAYI